MEVWESDPLDVHNISKYNDNYKYLLTLIDVFQNLLHVVTLKSKTICTGCNRRNVRDFGTVFLRSNYTDITQNTYIQS